MFTFHNYFGKEANLRSKLQMFCFSFATFCVSMNQDTKILNMHDIIRYGSNLIQNINLNPFDFS